MPASKVASRSKVESEGAAPLPNPEMITPTLTVEPTVTS
jgi:hypothetical protein